MCAILDILSMHNQSPRGNELTRNSGPTQRDAAVLTPTPLRDVTSPVMISAVRYFCRTFGSWSQKKIVALPMPAIPPAVITETAQWMRKKTALAYFCVAI